MANFPTDPRPFIPRDFDLVDVDFIGPPDRTRAFLGTLSETNFEHVSIASFHPPVHKMDFGILQRKLSRELRIHYNAPNVEIQPLAIGDAFVCFSSPP